jgi:hypothetical protein
MIPPHQPIGAKGRQDDEPKMFGRFPRFDLTPKNECEIIEQLSRARDFVADGKDKRSDSAIV